MKPAFAYLRITSDKARWSRRRKKHLKATYVLLVTEVAIATAVRDGKPVSVSGLRKYGQKLLKRTKFSIGSGPS